MADRTGDDVLRGDITVDVEIVGAINDDRGERVIDDVVELLLVVDDERVAAKGSSKMCDERGDNDDERGERDDGKINDDRLFTEASAATTGNDDDNDSSGERGNVKICDERGE